MKNRIQFVLVLAILMAPFGAARAATGVSEERLSLPEGPGSLEGIGENAEVNTNMGAMSYSVGIDLPQGFPGLTPSASLSYSSSNGTSPVGIGWSMEQPSIERLTMRGLPTYTVADGIAVEGSDELVLVDASGPLTYRARFEKGFVRYRWNDAGQGAEGWWTAEQPDGLVSYYGADHNGATVADARTGSDQGTFRWHLVETVDRWGHVLRYTWKQHGSVTLLDSVGWVFTDGTTPEYEVRYTYEDRYDKVSDCKAGYEELLDQRLARIEVFAHGTRLRYYDLSYEDYATSGGFTRLTGVQKFSQQGEAYPAHDTFEYSRALGVDACPVGTDCQRPYVVGMGSLGVDITQGKTTLMDINGDSLPDVLDTSEPGAPHRFFLNRLAFDRTVSFQMVESSLGNQGSHALGTPYTQVLDVNGDGFTDLVNLQTGDVLLNRGAGDWSEILMLGVGGGLPDLGGDGVLVSTKFFDYDGDKRIDLLFSRDSGTSNTTMAWRNTESGFVKDENVQFIGEGFETPALELNDMNGDGLLDVVVVQKDSLRYRLNFGWGHWGDWRLIAGFDFTDQEAVDAELEDLNGDGLADLVLVAGNQIRYWVNRNGTTFDPQRTISDAEVQGTLPEKTPGTTVLFSDMNGNGSSDIVWVQGDASGAVTYLELFPVRPNLLARITNGLGRVTDVTYTSSVEERVRDAATALWQHPLPFPMTVVKSMDEWDLLSQVHTVTGYAYHDGYYDGEEKRFRGYTQAEGSLAGDDLQESGQSFLVYDVGATDPYRAGLLISEEHRSDGRSIEMTTTQYAECAVTGVPLSGLVRPVRHVCPVGQVEQRREGAPETEWVRVETAWQYDGYGNAVLVSKLGVTAIGGACPACDEAGYTGTPCGEQCLGDETHTRTDYATPADNEDRWILNKAVRVRAFGVADADGMPATDLFTDVSTFYDGDSFAGLSLGQVTRGAVSRVVERVDTAGATIDKVRNAFDANGNVIDTLDPLGVSGGDTHRRTYQMDADGLRVVAADVHTSDGDGPYTLRQEVQYDTVWDKPVESTAWMLVEAGTPKTPRNATYYTYDDFGRITSRIRPGESLNAPGETYGYELGSPVSRVIVNRRSTVDGIMDMAEARCIDGRGRTYQTRELVAEGAWRVKGFTRFTLHGNPRDAYYPYLAADGNCDLAPPDGVLAQRTSFDAVGRKIGHVAPPALAGDDAVQQRWEFLPLSSAVWDGEDTREGGPHAGTPEVRRRNGLDQTTRIDRRVTAEGSILTHRVAYDELGRLVSLTDPSGAVLTQTLDLLSRPLRVDHPDSGTTQFEFDAVGKIVRQEDARGHVLRMTYDGLNRMVAQWDEADPDNTTVRWIYDRAPGCPTDLCTNVNGRLVTQTWLVDGLAASETFGYDNRGAILRQRKTVLGHTYDFASRRDNAQRIVSNEYPDSRAINATLDGTGQTVTVPGYVSAVHYAATGIADAITTTNGVQSVLTLDGRRRPQALTVTGPGSEVLLAYDVVRDALGNPLEVHDGRAEDGTPKGAARFTYDGLYRLTRAELDPDRPSQAETLTYVYDDADRVLSIGSTAGAQSRANVGELVYGEAAGPHAVTRAGDMTLGYDPAGNATTRGDLALEWDHLGRLVRATRAGAELLKIGYGPERDRMVKREDGHVTLYLADDFEVRDGTAVTYLDLAGGRLARLEDPSFAEISLSDVAPAAGSDTALISAPDHEITAGDAWLAQGVAAGALSLAAAPVLSDTRVLLHASAARTLHGLEPRVTWLHEDLRGNTVAETDDTGALVARSEFYPYGGERHSQGPTETHNFTGKETDDSTGLAYFGARYQDPWLGRWLSPDPAYQVMASLDDDDAAEATCAYGFVGNNPVAKSDADGQRFSSMTQHFWAPGRLGLKQSTTMLQNGQIRPNVMWMTLLHLEPGQPMTKKQAQRVAKTIWDVSKKDGSMHEGAYTTGSATRSEWRMGVDQLQRGGAMREVGGKMGFNLDVRAVANEAYKRVSASKIADALVPQYLSAAPDYSLSHSSASASMGEAGNSSFNFADLNKPMAVGEIWAGAPHPMDRQAAKDFRKVEGAVGFNNPAMPKASKFVSFLKALFGK